MRIAQVAPLAEAVPPKLYGGTERIVSYLTEELVAMGHEVTLFASGDSITAARLAKVPTAYLKRRVSPVTTVTRSTGTPRVSAATWAKAVSWPWPWVVSPVATTTVPLVSTRTMSGAWRG